LIRCTISKKKKTKQNKTKQNKTKQNKTKQNKTKQNKTKQNKTKQNKTKQNKVTISRAAGYVERQEEQKVCEAELQEQAAFRLARGASSSEAHSHEVAYPIKKKKKKKKMHKIQNTVENEERDYRREDGQTNEYPNGRVLTCEVIR
jgi:hypothetical protein